MAFLDETGLAYFWQQIVAKIATDGASVTPLFANSVDELTASGDTTKLYVLPDGYIYAYINGAWANTRQAFTSFDMLNKLKDACVD